MLLHSTPWMFFFLLAQPCFLSGQTIPISAARNQPLGALVQVRGLVTNGPELGKIRFLQDASAGIAAYPGAGTQPGFEANIQTGDSVELSGYLVEYNGLLEISPVLTYQILSRNRPLPAAKAVVLKNLDQSLEGQLLSIDCLSFPGSGPIFNSAGAYPVADVFGQSSRLFLQGGHPLLGTAVPAQPVRMQAILSYYNGFQLLPRTVADFSPATCLFFSAPLQQSNIQQDRFDLSWATSTEGTAWLRYGTNPDSLNTIVATAGAGTMHVVQLSALQAGSIYWTQAFTAAGADTLFSEKMPFATQSASSGQIKVFFNQGIELAAANGLKPDGETYAELLAETLKRIQQAQSTIDAAIYNNNRSDLTAALQAAQGRGVRVRYIAEPSNGNTALGANPGFPVLYNNSGALMHHKFLAIDANLPEKAWVMTGSMNWTGGNMIQDYNNSLFIQDQSLARAYEMEFEEMWGGSGAAPNPANSRFGSAKKDNTPHQFIIGGRPVECYFSPSDQVTSRILSALQTTQHKLSFAIFTFTKDEIADALIAAYQAGAWARGIIENTNDPGAEYARLLGSGLPTKDHPAASLLHHKYAVIDAGYPASDPTVVTGSHNWTQAAESSNDENTLVIHDADLATLYQAEFERRWLETGTAVHHPDAARFQVFPNPVRDRLTVKSDGDRSWQGRFTLQDITGRILRTGAAAGPEFYLNVGDLPAGSYRLNVQTDRGQASFSIQTLPH